MKDDSEEVTGRCRQQQNHQQIVRDVKGVLKWMKSQKVQKSSEKRQRYRNAEEDVVKEPGNIKFCINTPSTQTQKKKKK